MVTAVEVDGGGAGDAIDADGVSFLWFCWDLQEGGTRKWLGFWFGSGNNDHEETVYRFLLDCHVF